MTHPHPRRRSSLLALATVVAGLAPPASAAWEPTGTQTVRLHGRDGQSVAIGSVSFQPRADGRTGFTLALDHGRLKDFFLSMKEFKCVEAPDEVMCHVPYPYPQPGTVGTGDLVWLEHSLLFLFKRPGEFGAKLWNGMYFKLQAGERGLVGTPQAIDLNLISAPPAQPGVPPYRPALRDDIAPGARWFERLTIE
ncbi:hypothetical protein [Ideonella sp. A 288]|uniref:hypothetical protein n=1 Tax=Ideonella sp. A 288 TaxID=1962181 RepID=UPI000B4ABE69|nr:hypothetical protein [Ideonella sp. A 288]